MTVTILNNQALRYSVSYIDEYDAPIDISGRTFAMSIYVKQTAVALAGVTVVAAGTVCPLVIPNADIVAAQTEADGQALALLIWEVLDNDADPFVQNTLTILNAPAPAIASAGPVQGPVTLIERAPVTLDPVIRLIGPPGPSWEASFDGPLHGLNATGSYDGRDTAPQGNLCAFTDLRNNAIKLYWVLDKPGVAPVLLSTIVQAGMVMPHGVVIRGKWLIATGQGDNGLWVFDISNPSSPSFVTTKTSANFYKPLSIATSGDLLAVVDTANNVSVQAPSHIVLFDFTDPANMVELGVWSAPAFKQSSKFAFVGSRIYTTVGDPTIALPFTQQFVVIDVSDPSAPATIGSVNLPVNAFMAEVQFVSNYAFISKHNTGGGFVIVDVTQPSAPVVIADVSLPTDIYPPNDSGSTGISVYGHYIAVGDLANGVLYIYDWVDPTAPVLVKSTTQGLEAPAKMSMQGAQLVIADRGVDNTGTPVAGASGLAIVDTGTPFVPTQRIGSLRSGLARIDGLLNAAMARIDQAIEVGGRAWFGASVGIRGNLRVAGAINSPGIARVIAYGNADVPLTGTTADTVLATFTLPKNSLGPNGMIEIDATYTCSASASIKKLRLKLNGNAISSDSIIGATSLSSRCSLGAVNRNATNSQQGLAGVGTFGVGEAVTTPPVSAVDTTSDVTCQITGQLSLGADTMTLVRWVARVTYAA